MLDKNTVNPNIGKCCWFRISWNTVLLNTFIIGKSAEFEILIDGVNIGRNSSCIGENVTYVSNITSSSHIWNIPDMVIDRTLGPGNHRPVIEEGYTFRKVSEDNNRNIISSLSVNSSAELNGISITCEDGININGARATTVAMVLSECYKNNFISL